MNNNSVLKESVKQFIKYLVWSQLKYEQGNKKNIFIFTSRRSGGTWLTEIIARQKGIRQISEPFALNHVAYPLVRLIPIQEHDQLINLDKEDLSQLKQYFELYLKGELIVNSEWNIFDSKLNYKSDRLVVKIPNALAMMQWFLDNYDAHFIYHIRHPIGQAQSCIKRGYKNTSLVYLKNPWFAGNVLTEEMAQKGHSVMESGTKLEKFVLNWCLENAIPLKLSKRYNVFLSKYEDMVMDPKNELSRLADFCSLQPPHKTKSYTKPSKTTDTKRKTQITKGERGAYHWSDEVDSHQINKCVDILKVFNIDIYSS